MRYEGDEAGRGEGRPERPQCEGRGPSRWTEIRRRAVLSVADAPGPLLVVLTDWWIRSR